MVTRLVPKTRTALRIDEMLAHGANAYIDVFRKIPPTYVLATAASQWTVECGIKPGSQIDISGGKIIWNIWNNNWGNITCKDDADTDKHALTTSERIKKNPDVWKEMTLYYKSYTTPQAGAVDYWNKLRDKFPKSLNSFVSGDMKRVAETLSREGYYTALVETYQKNLDYFFPRYVKLLLVGKEIVS
jgi:hypothetical protein